MCVFVFFSLHLSVFRFKFVFVFSPHTDSFRWVKDGKEFRRELFESGTLTADEKEELRSYQGSYRCYVANELGTAVSDLARLITEREWLLKRLSGYDWKSIMYTPNVWKRSRKMGFWTILA